MEITPQIQAAINEYDSNREYSKEFDEESDKDLKHLYYDFKHNGSNDISDIEIREWMTETIKSITSEIDYTSTGCGNTLVYSNVENQEDGKYSIRTVICRNYIELTLFDVDLDNIDRMNEPKVFFEKED